MAYFKLTILEFRALAVFMNASTIPGLALKIGGFEESEYELVKSELQKHGLLIPAERKSTWHIEETLMLAMTAVVNPEFVVMVRDLPRKASILFYILDDLVTEIVVTAQHVGVSECSGLKAIAEHALQFLDGSSFGQVAVAHVQDSRLEGGAHIEIKENTIALSSTVTTVRSPQAVECFIRNTIGK